MAEVEVLHLQDHRGEVGALDFRLGELGALVEIVLVVQPDADAVGDATAAALTLVGRGLRDVLDRQALHLAAPGIARDARDAGIDHVANARHGQRGLGDVGREHDAAFAGRVENLVLLGAGQPGQQRQDFGVAPAARVTRVLHLFLQRILRFADIALTAEEHQDIAATILAQFFHRVDDAVLQAEVGLVVRAAPGTVAHLDRVRAARHVDDRRVVEMARETLRVDRRRGDDDLQVAASRDQAFDVTQQEVDVQAALVRLVDDQRVVLVQVRVVMAFGQQHAVGHQLDVAVLVRLVAEAHLETDFAADLDTQFLGDARSHRARRQPPRLGVADFAANAEAGFEADLRQLRGLAGTGFAAQDRDRVRENGVADQFVLLRDRQVVGIRDRGHAPAAGFHSRDGAFDFGGELFALRIRIRAGFLQLVQTAAETVHVVEHAMR